MLTLGGKSHNGNLCEEVATLSRSENLVICVVVPEENTEITVFIS